jgi:hypothetical protein
MTVSMPSLPLLVASLVSPMKAPDEAILVLIPGFLMQISLSVPAARACRNIAKGHPC